MNLTDFVQLFPLIEPPITMTDESIFALSKNNKLINLDVADQFMSTFEPDYEAGLEREYIPCVRLALSDEFHSLIYWRAAALNYEYYLINVDKRGKLLSRRLIGGLIAKDDTFVRLAVSVDANYIFYVAAQLIDGPSDVGDSIHAETLDAQTFSLEVLPDGSIVTS